MEDISSNTPFTRSKSTPHNKSICFFCDELAAPENQLFRIEKSTVQSQLEEAVTNSKNDKWKVKLSTAVDNKDATAIDVSYHRPCWRTNVFHALRQNLEVVETKSLNTVAEVAAEIEFSSAICSYLSEGYILTMSPQLI